MKRIVAWGFILSFFLMAQAHSMCERLIRQYEVAHGIPDQLLTAISLVESGRNIPGLGVVAWPWTINAQGKSYVFATKQEAIAMVRKLQKSGIKSIDVGCMQINLKHHPNAFRNLEEAFDPQINISYAASFLKQKREDTGSWHDAVAHYHSATPSRHTPYRNRVMKTRAKLQGGEGPVLQPAVLTEQRHFTTLVQPTEGQKIPVKVQFGPYTGLKSTIPRATKTPTRVKVHSGFFPINAPSSSGKEKVIHASYRLSRISADRLPKSSQGQFFPIR
jgi:hypothetical protein